jgi:hypothetical protein
MDELQLFGKPDTAERKISFEIVSTATKIVLQHICMPSQQSNAERTSQKITQANLDGYLKLEMRYNFILPKIQLFKRR